MAIRVTVWNEYLHEVQFPEVAEVYPKGIHGCIADFLKEAGMDVKTATLRRAGTRTDSGGCRQYGCVDLVGSHGSSGSVG